MPQMMPMFWLLMFFMMLIMLLMTMILLHFLYLITPLMFTPKNKFKASLKKWNWKW